MFAGKTETLISRVQDAEARGLRAVVIRPVTDTRSPSAQIASHAGRTWHAVAVAVDGKGIPDDVDFLGVDEAQFFGPEIVSHLLRAVARGVSVVAVGLDLTFKAEPFGLMPSLLAFADRVTKLRSVCAACQDPEASRTFRRATHDATVLVGGAEAYEPRCVPCHELGM
jgi:thymidine kinase